MSLYTCLNYACRNTPQNPPVARDKRYCRKCFEDIHAIIVNDTDRIRGYCDYSLCKKYASIADNTRHCEDHQPLTKSHVYTIPIKTPAIYVLGDATITGALHCPALVERLLAMEERIHELEQALLYAPGGVPFAEGEQRWREFVENEAAATNQ